MIKEVFIIYCTKINDAIRFAKIYFRSSRIKRFLIFLFLGIIFLYLSRSYYKLIQLTILFIIGGLIKYFTFPDLLYSEAKKSIENCYSTSSEMYQNYNSSNLCICNIKKWDGPTMGVLEVSKGYIKFSPFKENLNDEKFLVDTENNNINDISIVNSKWSMIDRLFFKELNQSLRISYDNSDVFIQMPNLENCSKLIKEKLGYKKHIT